MGEPSEIAESGRRPGLRGSGEYLKLRHQPQIENAETIVVLLDNDSFVRSEDRARYSGCRIVNVRPHQPCEA